MAERIQKQTPEQRHEVEPVPDMPEVSEQGEEIKADIDGLLDEIDDVLETNAEDFVRSYVQKGGQ